jgi:hypothetical protein
MVNDRIDRTRHFTRHYGLATVFILLLFSLPAESSAANMIDIGMTSSNSHTRLIY